jgi:hypothetical protein
MAERPISKSIDPTDFFADREVGGEGPSLILLYDRSARPSPELAGSIDFENDRTDLHVTSEHPVEGHIFTMEINGHPDRFRN